MNRTFLGALLVVSLELILAPVSAQQPDASLNPKKSMAQARAAMLAGHDSDALKLYEAVVSSQSRDAAKYRADALYSVAILRLSAGEPDTARAEDALNELTKSYPTSEHRYEAAALTRSFQRIADLTRRAKEAADDAKRASDDALTAKTAEAAGYEARIAALTAELQDTRSEIDAGKNNASRSRRELTTLQSENKTLRDQLAKLQAELSKKDQALRKIAGSIVNK